MATNMPCWVRLAVRLLMPIFLPVGITPSVRVSALGRVFHLRHSMVRPLFAGRPCFLPNWAKIRLLRAFSSSSVS